MHTFLAAITAAPDDDTPRLIYADALQETGDPADADRAEFIRLQIALAQEESPPVAAPPPDHPQYGEAFRVTAGFRNERFGLRRDLRVGKLRRRTDELLATHAGAWAAAAGHPARAEFVRGFAEIIEFDAAEYVPQAAEIVRTVPVRELELRGGDATLGILHAAPLPPFLKRLHVTIGRADFLSGHSFFRRPELAGVPRVSVVSAAEDFDAAFGIMVLEALLPYTRDRRPEAIDVQGFRRNADRRDFEQARSDMLSRWR